MPQPYLSELAAFVRDIANLTKEGECPNERVVGGGDEADCEGFVWENDDAFETLHELISRARSLVGQAHGDVR